MSLPKPTILHRFRLEAATGVRGSHLRGQSNCSSRIRVWGTSGLPPVHNRFVTRPSPQVADYAATGLMDTSSRANSPQQPEQLAQALLIGRRPDNVVESMVASNNGEPTEGLHLGWAQWSLCFDFVGLGNHDGPFPLRQLLRCRPQGGPYPHPGRMICAPGPVRRARCQPSGLTFNPVQLRHAPTGGRRPAHGAASSNWPANDSSVSSSPKRPTNCTPMGRPSAFQCSGNEIPGWPVTLKGGVNGT
jgi:hypothetical protein